MDQNHPEDKQPRNGSLTNERIHHREQHNNVAENNIYHGGNTKKIGSRVIPAVLISGIITLGFNKKR